MHIHGDDAVSVSVKAARASEHPCQRWVNFTRRYGNGSDSQQTCRLSVLKLGIVL